MTKGQKAQADAINAVLKAGFVEDGETRSETIRIGTTRAPIYGGIGGQLATFGGRPRFAKPGTICKVTIGKVTTCFYEVKDGKANTIAAMPTYDLDKIKFFATGNLANSVG